MYLTINTHRPFVHLYNISKSTVVNSTGGPNSSSALFYNIPWSSFQDEVKFLSLSLELSAIWHLYVPWRAITASAPLLRTANLPCQHQGARWGYGLFGLLASTGLTAVNPQSRYLPGCWGKPWPKHNPAELDPNCWPIKS